MSPAGLTKEAITKIADYAYVLETGKMVLSGSADEVRHNPRVMEAYLGGRVE